ncbi:hypothetical protein [Rhizohabitans arisaemae]|uniref:hypothetical protein n=1 Tax=Rhizohabitans arisaemae TaxID=2720610 RepID=UPI0024B15E6D|nr:hypothetical protein [Rhizohabitans arisaemae]
MQMPGMPVVPGQARPGTAFGEEALRARAARSVSVSVRMPALRSAAPPALLLLGVAVLQLVAALLHRLMSPRRGRRALVEAADHPGSA